MELNNETWITPQDIIEWTELKKLFEKGNSIEEYQTEVTDSTTTQDIIEWTELKKLFENILSWNNKWNNTKTVINPNYYKVFFRD